MVSPQCCDLLRLGERQPDGHFESPVGDVLRSNGPIVQADGPFCHRQSDTGASAVAIASLIDAHEGQENPLQVGLGYAGPVIANTCPFNYTGHPAISVPCAKLDGLPVGLMLVAPHFREDVLLQAAAAYQRSVDWARLIGTTTR